MATKITAAIPVFSMQKYTKPKMPVTTAPIIYMVFHPMRSDRYPKKGIEKKDKPTPSAPR